MKATKLTDAISIFNPREPLQGKELAEFYVDRPGNPLEAMKIYLLGLRGQPIKLLFSGHRGCGKSTELNRLAESLKRNFFIVPVNLARFANVTTLSYQDILLGMALSLYKRAEEKDAIARSPAEAVKNAWQDAIEYLQKRVYGEQIRGPLPKPEEVTVKFSIWVAELEAKYSLTPNPRQQLSAYLDEHLDELHQQIDTICTLIWKELKRPVLFIIEGIDKTDISRAWQIFCENTNALTAFQASAIYTFPIGLAYSGEFKQFTTSFNNHFTLPNLKLAHRDGQPDPQSIEQLNRVVLLRISDELIDPAALDMLVQASGGVVVLLIRATQSAIVHALSRGTNKVSLEDAQAAVAKERNDFVRLLRTEDYPILYQRHQDKELSADPAVPQLLHSLALLEYANQAFWCDVHPVIVPLLEERIR